jgi:hypothetical protein
VIQVVRGGAADRPGEGFAADDPREVGVLECDHGCPQLAVLVGQQIQVGLPVLGVEQPGG